MAQRKKKISELQNPRFSMLPNSNPSAGGMSASIITQAEHGQVVKGIDLADEGAHRAIHSMNNL